MINKDTNQVRQFQTKERFSSFTLLLSYLWVLLAPVSVLYSQPANVPDFIAPQLSNQTFNQYVNQANQAHSLEVWNTIVSQGFGVFKASWENLASQEIAALEATVHSQYANDPATAAYIDKMIESQASTSEQAWLTQIETQVAEDQNAFLLSLQSSQIPAQTDSNYQAVLTNGLQNFSDSLTSLQQNYQNQLSAINQTDKQYQANLQQLQTYETAVRNSISTSVSQLESSLQNTALYYNRNVDGSVNWSSLNQSGTELQTLISNLYQGLQNGSSLSTLATEMTSYLQTQETQAVQNANYWTQQSQPYSLTNSNTAFGSDYQLSGFQALVDYANSVRSSNSAINAIMTYIDGGSNSQDSTLLNYLYSTYGYDPTKTQIVGITSADFMGESSGTNNYNPFPVTLGHSGNNLNYSTSGLGAFDFSATGLWAFGILLPVTAAFTEDTFSYTINFQVKDLTAGANAQTWNGFASSLNSELGTWNTLAPSITNWEGQVAAYQAQYAAWHAQAVAYENNLQISYSNGVQTLNTEKQTWLAGIQSQASLSSSSAQTSKFEDDSKSLVKLEDSSPKISSVFLPSSSDVLAPALAPNVDSSGLNNVLSIFQQSLMGASNLALENQLNQQAISEKQNAINKIASSLGSNAVVDSHGNITYTTAIEDGHAKLKDGGDATNVNDYIASKTNETVYVGAPATISIAGASPSDLFQSWDTNSVLSQFQTNESSFNQSYSSAISTLNAQINALNTLNAKNDASFQEEAQAAASYATNVQSLAKTMLQGGTFQSWVQGQIQDKVNSAMAQALANATGMSPDMAAQLVSWFEKNQAEKKAKAKARTEEITSGLVTVASIALSFVAGPEMMAVGQAVLQAAQGYQNGGMEGALVGAASGAATAYAREFGVNVGVSYSYSGGFGGTVGLGSSKLNAGVTFSQHGSTSFNMGGSYGNVSYNPTSGFSGSVNLTPGQNTGVMVNVAQHSGPSLTVQESNEASGIGGSVTIDGKGNTTVAATYRNATVVSATGNVHDPSSFGNLTANENFNSDLNQNLAMGKADENLKAGTAELEAGRSKIAETGNEVQREILNNENASAQDQHGVLATLANAGEFLTDPSSASTWLGRTAQDVVGSFLGSTGLGASDSNGFIDKDGNYRQRTCFTAETLIRTTDGLKRIDQIQVGDFVLSINENTGKVSYKRVTQLFVHDVGLIHRVTYENGSTLNTTWNHPFYLRSTGWTEVKDIRLNERSVTIASIRNSEKAKITSNSGVLLGASLASLNKQTSNQEYSNSWKNEYKGTLGITKVEEVYTNTKVYNFEVEDNHTYFVGKDGVLVHNYLPEFADQINQRVTEIKGAINDPVGTAKAVAENQFSKEGLQRTAIDALTLGQGRNIENLVNATGVNGEEAAARAHANFVFDGVLGIATEGVGKVLSSLRGLSGAAKEVSAGTKAAGAAAAEEGAIARKAGSAGGSTEGLLSGAEREAALNRSFAHDPTGEVVSGIENLTKKLPWDKPVVVIGENMERVNPVRDALINKGYDVRTYDPKNFRSVNGIANPKDIAANRSWMNYWSKGKGANIVDIGTDPTRPRTKASPFYGIEVKTLYGKNKYPNVMKYVSE
ncbi:TIGR04388 family protein [Leptospira inadai]|uniref:Intein-containing large structural protein n=1 Tax=Leptospira inadai serovar Lyme TaxID=293084 RepID=A0ABX4YDY5_9LEPT|nr:TIGR04388 family protein [Leptospira inadai]PNV72620.1 intein-containing large structural protein [Leptospira inadai serovar Lyme]